MKINYHDLSVTEWSDSNYTVYANCNSCGKLNAYDVSSIQKDLKIHCEIKTCLVLFEIPSHQLIRKRIYANDIIKATKNP